MKRPLSFAKTYVFEGEEPWDYARPLRAMSQWVMRHPDVIVHGINVHVCEEDAAIHVILTVEEPPC